MPRNTKQPKLTSIGLPVKEAEIVAAELNILLANFQVYYQNLRGLHWNIRGKGFFDLHVKFEELYTDAQLKIDLIAERILTLDGHPLHAFDDYLKYNKLQIGKNIHNDEKAIHLILDSLSLLLKIERVILKKSDEIEDEGTTAMISDFISAQEKTIWMMRAWLESED